MKCGTMKNLCRIALMTCRWEGARRSHGIASARDGDDGWPFSLLLLLWLLLLWLLLLVAPLLPASCLITDGKE